MSGSRRGDVPERLGRYLLLEPLGQGGSARVYRAELQGAHGFRKPVALKILDAPADGVPDSLLAEARLGGLIQHPNVVSTLEVGQVDGHWFISMELVRGPTAHHLLRDGPLPLRPALDLGAQVAAGLHYLHTLEIDGQIRPITHRDIKPSNLLLDPSGLVRIADLGIAGFKRAEQVAGTPGYMPPEQVEGASSPRSDLFALGATLYRLLTAERLLGKGREALFRALHTDAIVRAPAFERRLAPLHPELPALLARCLAVDPEARWATAAELGLALRKLMLEVEGPALTDRLTRREAPALRGTASMSPFQRRPLPPLPDGRRIGHDELLRTLEAAPTGRPVVLVGTYGIGKTRLALEATHRARRAAWLYLATPTPLRELVVAIARAAELELPNEPGIDWLVGVLQKNRALVLVTVDGAESLNQEAWEGLATLARATPLRWLATSRLPPPLAGFTVLEVPPLTLVESRRLFQQIARRPVDAPLLERLGGIPLALEIAASSDDTPDLPTVTAGPDDATRPMETVLRGAWASLSTDEQRVLAQLSCFAGHFRPEDAEAVVQVEGADWVVERLASLLKRRVLEAQGCRYVLAPSIREFAATRLMDDERRAVRDRHAHHFARLGRREMLDRLERAGSASVIERLYAAHDDLRAAFQHATRLVPEAVPGVATAMLAIVLYTGPATEGMQIIDEALDAPHTPGSLVDLLRLGFVAAFRAGHLHRAEVLAEIGQEAAQGGPALGEFLWMRGVLAPLEDRWRWLARAEKQARRHADPLLLARIENSRSVAARKQGELRAAARHEQNALRFATGAGSETLMSLILTHRASRRTLEGELEAAATDYLEALELQKRQRSVTAYVLTLLALGSLRLRQGQVATARELLEECARRMPALGTGRSDVLLMYWRGALAWAQGHRERAVEAFHEAARAADDVENPELATAARVALAHHALDCGDPVMAGQLLADVPFPTPPHERAQLLDARIRLALREHTPTASLLEEVERTEEEVNTPWTALWCGIARARDQHGAPRHAHLDRLDSRAQELGLDIRSPVRSMLLALAEA